MAPAPGAGELPKGMAVASMILGIVSLVLFCIWWISLPCAIVAIILGLVARSKAAAGVAGGKGMATTGLVCGIISILLLILLVGGLLAFLGFAGPEGLEAIRQAAEEAAEEAAPATEPGAMLLPAPRDVFAWLA